jgi:hypothetical protein
MEMGSCKVQKVRKRAENESVRRTAREKYMQGWQKEPRAGAVSGFAQGVAFWGGRPYNHLSWRCEA